MASLISQIESILFLATKPVKFASLKKHTEASKSAIAEAINTLSERYAGENSGLRLIEHNNAYQIVTAPDNAELVEKVYSSEMTGELTKPALETLTIIAYRGPITKPELELVRGINCSLILRNLAMRGLIQEDKAEDELLNTYTVDPEFLQYLGMTSVDQLPKYEELHSHELLEELLKQRANE